MDLSALRVDFPLLRSQSMLRAGVFGFLILQMVSDREACCSAQAAADRGARERMADGRPDDRTSTRAHYSPDPGPLLTRGQWLTRTSCHEQHGRQSGPDDPKFALTHGFSSNLFSALNLL
jgi:hypothetical protein